MRLASDRVNPKKFYAYDLQGGAAYVSDDSGAHFKVTARVLTSLPEYNLVVGSLQAVPDFEGHVWATGGKDLFHSSDGGQSFKTVFRRRRVVRRWLRKSRTRPKVPCDLSSGKVNGVTGFFRSDDEGASFVRINDDAHQYGGSNVIIGDPRVYGRAPLLPAVAEFCTASPSKAGLPLLSLGHSRHVATGHGECEAFSTASRHFWLAGATRVRANRGGN